MVRLMTTFYIACAIVAAFYIGLNTTVYPEGVLFDSACVSYWFEFEVAQ